MSKKNNGSAALLLTAALLSVSAPSSAFTWSATYIGYRYGTQFHEPGTPNAVRKNILQLTHADGYALGGNFLNLDIL
jgi:hypothetical protein